MKSNCTGKQRKIRTDNKPIMERFISFLPINYKEESMIDSCWNWQGAVIDNRYGCISYNGKNFAAHRMSYKLFKGTLKPGLVVMHTCDNPKCVNPKHLLLGTHSDNMRDMSKKGRGRGKNIRPRHKLTISNLMKIISD